MKIKYSDIVVVGAGPVGLMCAYLGKKCHLKVTVIDKSDGPLKVGRADAFNARTLQLLEMIGLFDKLYPLGRPCSTSSVWQNGEFISRDSSWWDELEGCLHKHFLMLGQSYIESLLDEELKLEKAQVNRSVQIENIEINAEGCLTTLSSGEKIQSKYVIGADGSQSFVRNHFKIPFSIIRPELTWAVLDAVIETDFPKATEIIVFQSETSDVAWIPREGELERFYVRMDKNDFTIDEVIKKINIATKPHIIKLKETIWFSQFSVKESVAEHFFVKERVFLAGDACHVHSVNGGQGLNTGLADAFNLMWKLNMVINHGAEASLLKSYQEERKPVAQSVIDTSGELVRATKYSDSGEHALKYLQIVQKHAGNITGMGIRYNGEGLIGTRLFDMEIYKRDEVIRLYSLLNYEKFTLLIFDNIQRNITVPPFVNIIQITSDGSSDLYFTSNPTYKNQALLVRPDSYIGAISGSLDISEFLKELLEDWDNNGL